MVLRRRDSPEASLLECGGGWVGATLTTCHVMDTFNPDFFCLPALNCNRLSDSAVMMLIDREPEAGFRQKRTRLYLNAAP